MLPPRRQRSPSGRARSRSPSSCPRRRSHCTRDTWSLGHAPVRRRCCSCAAACASSPSCSSSASTSTRTCRGCATSPTSASPRRPPTRGCSTTRAHALPPPAAALPLPYTRRAAEAPRAPPTRGRTNRSSHDRAENLLVGARSLIGAACRRRCKRQRRTGRRAAAQRKRVGRAGCELLHLGLRLRRGPRALATVNE